MHRSLKLCQIQSEAFVKHLVIHVDTKPIFIYCVDDVATLTLTVVYGCADKWDKTVII